jgi:Predicted signal transduction protein with a C-terminal ATPase domain
MITIFLLFSSVVLIIWYSELKKEAETTAIQNAEHLLQVSNTIFENQVHDIINIAALTTVRSSNSLSTNIITILSQKNLTNAEIVSYRRTASDYLISLCSYKNNLNGLILSDFDGNSLIYGLPTSFEVIKENNWLSFIKGKKVKYAFIPPHYPDKWYNTEKDLVFSVIEPVLGFNGEQIGFVNADIRAELFQECFDTSSSASSSLYVVNKKDGTVLFRPSYNLLNMGINSHASSAITKKLTSKAGYFFITNKKEKMLVVYNTSSLTNWTTLNVIPEKEIVAAFSNTSHKIILITTLIGILLIICVFCVTSLLTQKIRLLSNAVKQVDEDCLDFPLDIQSYDEIGALSAQFKAMLERIRQLVKKVKSGEEAKHKAEIAVLQSQMNPHFLYNSLNTIKFLASIQGIDNIGNVAESLSSLMHINMDGRSFIHIQEDAAFIQSYLEIQNYRYINTFEYRIHIEDSAEPYMIPKLLIQPLVENSLKHGLKGKSAGGILRIDYLIDGNHLKVIVEDNGSGISDERIQDILNRNLNTNAGHIGIYNIRERIHMYFGPDYDIEIISQPGIFTRFEIMIPIITENEVKQYV